MGPKNKAKHSKNKKAKVSTPEETSSSSTAASSSSISASVFNNSSDDVIEEAFEVVNSAEKKGTTVVTIPDLLRGVSDLVNESYSGDVKEFFTDFGYLLKRRPLGVEENVTDSSSNVDVSPIQLFENFIATENNEDTIAWLNAMKLPNDQAFGYVFSSDLIGQSFNDLSTANPKQVANPLRRSYTTYLNKISKFQCFFKPTHLTISEWKGLESLIIGYVVDKLIHFFITKKITFNSDDLKKTRNADGTYTLHPSIICVLKIY